MSDLGYCPHPLCGQPGIMRRGGSVQCINRHWHPEADFNPPARGPVKEATIELYFIRRVKETGGMTRKVTWPGIDGAPDRMAGWPSTQRHGLVELKRPGGKPELHQLREHDRLRAIGFRVDVIDTKEGVDAYVSEMSNA